MINHIKKNRDTHLGGRLRSPSACIVASLTHRGWPKHADVETHPDVLYRQGAIIAIGKLIRLLNPLNASL